jgi:hypothetical protein
METERSEFDALNSIEQQMKKSASLLEKKEKLKQRAIYKGVLQQLQCQRDYYFIGYSICQLSSIATHTEYSESFIHDGRKYQSIR